MSTHPNDPLSSNVASLINLTEYQEGAIVSRPIINRKYGSVTLFAFDEGQELSEHTTRLDALVQILDGTAEVVVDGVPHRISTGEAILMPANLPHALSAITPVKMVLTMIHSDDN